MIEAVLGGALMMLLCQLEGEPLAAGLVERVEFQPLEGQPGMVRRRRAGEDAGCAQGAVRGQGVEAGLLGLEQGQPVAAVHLDEQRSFGELQPPCRMDRTAGYRGGGEHTAAAEMGGERCEIDHAFGIQGAASQALAWARRALRICKKAW